MYLNLVENGIFPIVFDKDGNSLENKTDLGLKLSGTVQGEGKLIGVSSLFLRTSGCNLRCSWLNNETNTGTLCDTPFSSFNPEKNFVNNEEIIQIIKANSKNIHHLVVTGGEPMLQAAGLIDLFTKLKNKYHLTLETNATLYNDKVSELVNLTSMSPKLSSSSPTKKHLVGTGQAFSDKAILRHDALRKNLKVVQAFIDDCYEPGYQGGSKYATRKPGKDFQLKFVLSHVDDIEEIKSEWLYELRGVKPSDVVIMPEGITRTELDENSKISLQACIENGWRFTPRMHIDLFGNKRSV